MSRTPLSMITKEGGSMKLFLQACGYFDARVWREPDSKLACEPEYIKAYSAERIINDREECRRRSQGPDDF